MEPQPIETAPKDKRIMVFNPMTGWYLTKKKGDCWPMIGWGDKEGLWFPVPTHWLPEPDIVDSQTV